MLTLQEWWSGIKLRRRLKVESRQLSMLRDLESASDESSVRQIIEIGRSNIELSGKVRALLEQILPTLPPTVWTTYTEYENDVIRSYPFPEDDIVLTSTHPVTKGKRIPNPLVQDVETALRRCDSSMDELNRRATHIPGLRLDLIRHAFRFGRIPVTLMPKPYREFFNRTYRVRSVCHPIIVGMTDIVFSQGPRDIDFSFAVDVEADERAVLSVASACPPETVLSKATNALSCIAATFGISVETLIGPPTTEPMPQVEDRPIHYVGPIRLSKGHFDKRILFDENSRCVFSSFGGASILHMGVDRDGTVFGNLDVLDELMNGRLVVAGDSVLSVGDVLRLLRLKHQWGLSISDEDYRHMESSLLHHKDGEGTASMANVKHSIEALLKTARNRDAAVTELRSLGLSQRCDLD